MTTIIAPARAGSRRHTTEMLAGLPDRLNGSTVEVMFPDGALGSTSFVDQMLIELIERRGVTLIRFVNAPEHVRRLADYLAGLRNLGDRVECSGAVEPAGAG